MKKKLFFFRFSEVLHKVLYQLTMIISKTFYRISNNWELSLSYPNNVIWNIGKFGLEFRDSHTPGWRKNTKKSTYKTLMSFCYYSRKRVFRVFADLTIHMLQYCPCITNKRLINFVNNHNLTTPWKPYYLDLYKCPW